MSSLKIGDRVRSAFEVKEGSVRDVSNAHGLIYFVKWDNGDREWVEPIDLAPAFVPHGSLCICVSCALFGKGQPPIELRGRVMLREETRKAVRNIVDRIYSLFPSDVTSVERVSDEKWVVHRGERPSATIFLGWLKTPEEREILQRAADETAGRVPTQDPYKRGDYAFGATASPFVMPEYISSKRAEAQEREWKRQVLGEWAQAEPSGKPHWRGAPVFAGPSKNQLRGTMEAMSNVMHGVSLALEESNAEDWHFQQGQQKEYGVSGGNGTRRASERWSAQVRAKVSALQPKVRVWCQGDWEED